MDLLSTKLYWCCKCGSLWDLKSFKQVPALKSLFTNMFPLHKLILPPKMKLLPRRKSITPEQDAAALFILCIIYLCKTVLPPLQRGMCNGRSVWVQVGNTGCGGENIKLGSISVGLNASVQGWKMGSERCCATENTANCIKQRLQLFFFSYPIGRISWSRFEGQVPAFQLFAWKYFIHHKGRRIKLSFLWKMVV